MVTLLVMVKPKTLETYVGDCIALQWTGSNTHNNGNPAGDGQAKDFGNLRWGLHCPAVDWLKHPQQW